MFSSDSPCSVRRFLGIASAALSLAAAPGAALAQGRSSVGAGRVSAQIAAGTLATPVSFVVGGLGSRWVAEKLGAGDGVARTTAYVGAWTGALVGTAAVPSLVVRGGNYPAALGGALIGGAAAGAAVLLGRGTFGRSASCNAVCVALGVVVVALPAVGATVAYNQSR